MSSSGPSSRIMGDLELYNVVGVGGFGVVVNVVKRKDGKKMALKVIPTRRGKPTGMNEVENYWKISPHPNVLGLDIFWREELDATQMALLLKEIGANKEVREKLEIPGDSLRLTLVCLLMESCQMDLKTWLKQVSSLQVSVTQNVNIFRQIVKGVKHIHEHHLIHRDLKPSNILLTTDKGTGEVVAKIGDLGYATEHTVQENSCTHTQNAGAALYQAPEQRISQRYGKTVDVYALGLILYQMFDPESQKNVGMALQKVIYNSTIVELEDKYAQKLVRSMIKYNPQERWGLDKVLNYLEIMSPDSKAKKSVQAQMQLGTTNAVVLSANVNSKRTGCEHYARKCLLECPDEACKRMVWCRLCHDEKVKGHQMDRKKVQIVTCAECLVQQPVGPKCAECETRFAKYYCDICHLFDDSESANEMIFHCAKCEICRRRKMPSMEYKHCDNCQICLPISTIDTHQCTSNAAKRRCLVCKKTIFDSTIPAIICSCGHYVHEACHSEFPEGEKNCPSCGNW